LKVCCLGAELRPQRIALGAALLAVSVPLVGWGSWPSARVRRTLTSSVSVQGSSDAEAESGAAAQERLLTVDYPKDVRVGDAQTIVLSLTPLRAEQAPPTPRPTLAQASLDLPGAFVLPAADFSELLGSDRSQDFRWSVRFSDPGTFNGTLWLFVVPANQGSQATDRRAVSAQSLEIQASKLLGLSGSAARLVGGAGILLTVLAMTPILDGILRISRRANLAGAE
jgi:hypothetical protein